MNWSRGMKYSCRMSVSPFKLFRVYGTESCIGSLRETKQASPSAIAWVRGTTVQDSNIGSTFFSRYHLRFIGMAPRLEKLKTNRRNLTPDTSPSGGTCASPISTLVYL